MYFVCIFVPTKTSIMKTLNVNTKQEIEQLKNESAVTIHTNHGQYVGMVYTFGKKQVSGNFQFRSPLNKSIVNKYENTKIKRSEINQITIG